MKTIFAFALAFCAFINSDNVDTCNSICDNKQACLASCPAIGSIASNTKDCVKGCNDDNCVNNCFSSSKGDFKRNSTLSNLFEKGVNTTAIACIQQKCSQETNDNKCYVKCLESGSNSTTFVSDFDNCSKSCNSKECLENCFDSNAKNSTSEKNNSDTKTSRANYQALDQRLTLYFTLSLIGMLTTFIY